MRITKYSIPKVLQEFHGEQAALQDLITTYLSGFFAAGFIYYLMPATIVLWKKVLLMLIAVDIGGGVVANFTEGTTRYHRKHPMLRLFFIAPLHLIHPIILAVIFKEQMTPTLLNASLIIVFAYVINYISEYQFQKTIAPFLLLIAITVNFISLLKIPTVSYLMALFAIKLILAYAVQWKS